jgi:hypothetical protein
MEELKEILYNHCDGHFTFCWYDGKPVFNEYYFYDEFDRDLTTVLIDPRSNIIDVAQSDPLNSEIINTWEADYSLVLDGQTIKDFMLYEIGVPEGHFNDVTQ